ncbi:DUF7149 domain-containing protein [Brachyspira catarrhinii]|uniref:site-specific DNA-methyltransferase (adenine-specific) n=1 Tax=Brachyspira catarrhinii TaxID=2528966 RepID=A0ABY2TR30_9SPIR|nr:Eco57I restriction-modification methylase domain-containing protein [Brachyspira catarrhinii]TKZ35038.1 class I SAM-dependent DNA methyltransferase [Brachyspira catarrhinii]
MAERLEFVKIEVKDFINQYFYRYKILENEFEKFKENLINYIEKLEKYKNQNEDSLVANCLSPFFKNLNFETQIKSKMNRKSEIDLAIFKDSAIQIIIEAKKPNDKDFFYSDNPNCKALHEAILYYFRIREENNFSIKYIILTDFYKFYIFEAKEFEKVFYRNKDFDGLYKSFTNQNSMFDGRTEEFYSEAKKILERKNFNLKGSFVDLSYISEILQEGKNLKTNFKNLKPYFKIFSKDFLLQEFNPNDANELNKGFYDELLHILGLSEKIINGKTLIVPSKNSIDREGTLYYNILQRLPENKRDEKENEINEKVLEILIIWINRILFLKLLESSLINFNNDKNLGFLNIEKIKDYNKLNYLFFNILAKNKEDRESQTAEDLAYLPYLNSSLFTRSEKEIIDISQLSNLKLEYFKNTQIKDENGKAKRGKEDWLKMIFEFLNSFDFGARDDNENILAQKDLINSSVLGLVFEKLNGYKEGSFYTPSFITSYMCKESLEKIVLQKFKENGLNADNLETLQKQILANMNFNYNFRDKAINILETIRICDPAVGSGHFLVSALNEIVYIYYKLGLLNIPISDLRIENDEILIKDNFGKNFEYIRPKLENDNHKIQREIFNLKKSIIENNLFGVDINRNSCEITKLRLWIELLKNSYYLSFDSGNYHNLQTLPNIDINIKCGNSLISYFDINQSLNRYPNIQDKIAEYKELVKNYKDGVFNSKIEIDKKIKELLESFRTFCLNDKFIEEMNKFYRLCREYNEKYGNYLVKDDKDLKKYFGQKNLFASQFDETEAKKDFEILIEKHNDIYNLEAKNPFEWRFAFPEILNDDGNFIGFDLVIGNPPYIDSEYMVKYMQGDRELIKNQFKITKGNWDIYIPFFEQGLKIGTQKSLLTFITPDKWIVKPFGLELRKMLASYIDIIARKGDVFDSARVDSIITIIDKNTNKENIDFYLNNEKINSIDREFVKNSKDFLLDYFYNNSKIINSIRKDKILLGSFATCVNACATADAYKLKPFIKELKNPTNNTLYIINTGTIGKYVSKFGIKPMKYIKDTYNKPICTKQDFKSNFGAKYNEIALSKKLIIKGLTLLDACIDLNGNIIPAKSTIVVLDKDSKKLKFLSAIINSKVAYFYIKEIYSSNSYCGGINFTKDMISSIPIPEINSENKELGDKIVGLVDRVIEGKKNNEDTRELEEEIDGIVYKLYDLTEEEIRIVENR